MPATYDALFPAMNHVRLYYVGQYLQTLLILAPTSVHATALSNSKAVNPPTPSADYSTQPLCRTFRRPFWGVAVLRFRARSDVDG